MERMPNSVVEVVGEFTRTVSFRFNDSDQEVQCYDPDGFSPSIYTSYELCVTILKKKGKR